MKYRIIETIEGAFYPQFKQYFFTFWKFFSKVAENNIDSGCMLLRAIETDDPANAAVFVTAEEAQAFTVRIEEKSQRYWTEDAAKRVRSIQGVEIKNIHKIK